ncbi:hypothetical protein ACFWBQ_38050, partial [Streptomyces sp. NPDC060035]
PLRRRRSGRRQGTPGDTVDEPLVWELYGLDADILRAPGDASPVVMPRSRADFRTGHPCMSSRP